MNPIRLFYKWLLTFYPKAFREQLAESMEQTFQDLWNEKRETKQGLFGFVIWTFIETALGIFREYLLLISPGDIMQTILKTFGSSALVSILIILPFMIMEIVNRRNLHENFPFMLFFAMWLNLFIIGLILLPIVRGKRKANDDTAHSVSAQGNKLLTNPKLAATISVILVLAVIILSLAVSLGWQPLGGLLHSPSPEQLYVFRVPVSALFVALILLSIPVATGIIASRPIVSTLRAGGSLFAHPINLTIVAFILSILAIGFANLLVDQWPCFTGIPNCD